MSFYIQLPSNASMDLFPQNTLQNYKVRLHNPIQIHGAYEVAIVEALYPNQFKTCLGAITIYKNDTNDEQEHSLNIFLYENQKLINQLDLINKQISKIFGLNKIWFEIGLKYFKIKLEANYALEISERIADFFKIDQTKFSTSYEKIFNDPNHNYFTKLVINNVPSISIYCSIIEFQNIGNQLVQLLRNMSINTDDKNKTYSTHYFNPPHYVKVDTSLLNEINIAFFDDIGEKILFDYGKLYVKLHFKPIQ